jgi:hypothetical protein
MYNKVKINKILQALNLIVNIYLYFKKENAMSHEDQVRTCFPEESVQCKIERGEAYGKVI